MVLYPKPSAIGGTLIRRVVATLKANTSPNLLGEPILIAVSGGVDSMVLAHLLIRYGRKVLHPSQVTLLHFDHGWRKESAKEEKELVKALADKLQVQFLHRKLDPPKVSQKSRNLEEDARLKRLEVYSELAGPGRAFRYVLTAHHRDDLAETVLFRFLRGEFLELGQGILFHDQQCLRPFLQVKKSEIYAYAKAEGVPYLEDPTNADEQQFRALARREIFPLLEKAHPGVREILASYPERLKTQKPSAQLHDVRDVLQSVLGKPLNRSQVSQLEKMLQSAQVGKMITLRGGARVRRTENGFLIENLDEGNQA